MELTNSLPKGPNTPRSLRLMKFIFQPIKYLDDYAKAYGDTFTIRGSKGTPIVYFSQPQALQTIFTADDRQLDAGRGNSGLEFLMGENSLLLLDGDRHQRQRQMLTPPFHGERMRAYGQIISEIAEQVMNATILNSQAQPIVKRTFNPARDYWWPVPQTQRDLNPELTQNANY